MRQYQLAQVNIGRVKAPIEGPLMAGFVARLDEINALAWHCGGFRPGIFPELMKRPRFSSSGKERPNTVRVHLQEDLRPRRAISAGN